MTPRWLFPAMCLLLAAALLGGSVAGCAVAPGAAGPSAAAEPASGPIRFMDAAAEMGLDFRLGHGGRSPLTILDTAGGGGALFDYDGDGYLDLLVVGERRLWLYRSIEGKRFEDVTDAAGLRHLSPGEPEGGLAPIWMGCAVGDIDNDGYPDVYVTGYRSSLLLRNLEGTGFEELSEAAGVRNTRHWETSAAFFDADGDGREDLYVARYLQFGASDQQWCVFREVEAACPPHYYDGEPGVFYRNVGGAQFRDETRAAGLHAARGKALGVAVADADGDGLPDLYIANDGIAADHFRNLGGGRFRNVGLEAGTAYTAAGRPHAGMGVDWGDVDNDGLPDLVVTTFQHESTALYHNRGGNGFSESGAERGLRASTLRRLGFGAKFADFDNDGRLDLLVANGHVQDTVHRIDPSVSYEQPPQVFHNDGAGGFRDVTETSGPALRRPLVGRALAVGDLNNNGRLDAVIINAEGAPLMLRNESKAENQWLGVRLEGVRSPRSGAGAAVTIRTAAGTQRRDSGTSGSYLAASDSRVHFGLGEAVEVDELVVRWRSGAVDRLRNVPAGRWVTVVEGESGS
jgi:enediyne biosynthesis protein E4